MICKLACDNPRIALNEACSGLGLIRRDSVITPTPSSSPRPGVIRRTPVNSPERINVYSGNYDSVFLPDQDSNQQGNPAVPAQELDITNPGSVTSLDSTLPLLCDEQQREALLQTSLQHPHARARSHSDLGRHWPRIVVSSPASSSKRPLGPSTTSSTSG